MAEKLIIQVKLNTIDQEKFSVVKDFLNVTIVAEVIRVLIREKFDSIKKANK